MCDVKQACRHNPELTMKYLKTMKSHYEIGPSICRKNCGNLSKKNNMQSTRCQRQTSKRARGAKCT
jgi:hypothetical protein